MGVNSVTAAGAKGRKDALQFDPNDLTLVTDKTHPLYDERIETPPSDEFVRNIKYHGVLKPILVRRNGEHPKTGKPIIEVVDGRQRVMAARIANEQLHKEGAPPIFVYGILHRAREDVGLTEVMVSTNEARREDTPLIRARKMSRLVDLGRTNEQIATVFCCTTVTVRNTLALLDLDTSVQKAVEGGKISASFAVKELAKIPRETQREHLETLLKSGAELKGEAGKANVRNVRKGEKPDVEKTRVRSRAFLERFLTELRNREEAEAAAVVSYVLGHDTALRDLPNVRLAANIASNRNKLAGEK